MTYDFIDVVQDAPAPSLPAEAMKWNGDYLDNAVPGYRTLYVKGREAFEVEISNNEVSSRDGAFYNRRHIRPRALTVGFQIVSESPEDFREAYNMLFTKLYDEQATIIFHDEEDYFYRGTVQAVPQPRSGQTSLVGEIEVLCSDPYKYAVSETSTQSETAYQQGYSGFVCNNGAYMKLKPRFEIEFGSDCGYFALTNERTGAEIVVGDIDAVDSNIVEIMSQIFRNQSSIPGTYSLNTTNLSSLGRYEAKLQSGAYYRDAYSNGTDVTKYGAGIRVTTTAEDWRGMYGGSLSYNLDSPVSSAIFTWEHYMVATASMQGFHRFSLDDANGDPIVAVAYYKGPDETTKVQNCEIIVNAGDAASSRLLQVSTEEKNPYTGSGKYTGNIKAPTSYGQGIGQIQFIMTDEYTVHVVVNVGAAVRFDEVLTSTTPIPGVSAVSFASGRYRKNTYLNQSSLLSWALESSDSIFYTRPIKAGDLIGIDTESGTITVNGETRYDMGSLGNNFEEMVLSPGQTNISMKYSDWYDGRPVGRAYWRDKRL